MNGTRDIIGESIVIANGIMTLKFSRLRVTGDTIGDNPFVPNSQSQMVIFALGPVTAGEPNYHGNTKTPVVVGGSSKSWILEQ